VVVLGLCGARTYRQSQIYESREVLFGSILAANPDHWFAYNNLASIYVGRGEVDKGRDYYVRAKTLYPRLAQAPDVEPASYAESCIGADLAQAANGALQTVLDGLRRQRDATLDAPGRERARQVVQALLPGVRSALADALAHQQRALVAHPDFVHALKNAGQCHAALYQLADDDRTARRHAEQAVRSFGRAIRHEAGSVGLRAMAIEVYMGLEQIARRAGDRRSADAHRSAARKLYQEVQDLRR
jgi:tetratricopeptide (TPR) repeat protein